MNDRVTAEPKVSSPVADAVSGRPAEVSLNQIHAGYGKKEILRGISLRLDPGEILSLIGPNGAGKSTLLKVIAGFLNPSSGQVYLSGREIGDLAPYERVLLGSAYCMQGGRVFPSLTVEENVDLAASRIPGDTRVQNLSECLDLFPRLRGLLARRAGLLSGGERQSLALAMTLARRPRVLLLDEPSAGLSPKLVHDVMEKVCQINRLWSLSVVLVEQNVREALSIAHRALVLVNGRIALESAEPAALLESSALEQLFLGGELRQDPS